MQIAIISDIHEDIINLKKAFSLINKHHCEKVFCLGDIIGYNPMFYNYFQERNASECLQLVKNNCCTVMGNHDLFHLTAACKNKNIEDKVAHYYNDDKLLAVTWEYAKELPITLSYDDINAILTYKIFHCTEIDKIELAFSHYLSPDLLGKTMDLSVNKRRQKEHYNFFNEMGIKITFYGHIHSPGSIISYFNFKKWINLFSFQQFLQKNGTITCSRHDFMSVSVPPIARNKVFSGFLIFDTISLNLSVVPIV